MFKYLSLDSFQQSEVSEIHSTGLNSNKSVEKLRWLDIMSLRPKAKAYHTFPYYQF